MASHLSNFVTLLIVALATFVALDIRNNDVYEKTITAKYLKHIGAAPYVDQAVLAVKKSTLYNQYFQPYWNAFVRSFRAQYAIVKREVFRLTNQAAVFIKRYSISAYNYVDRVALPTLRKHSHQIGLFVQKYSKLVYAALSEYTLVVSDWLNSNILKKLPQEEMQKSFTEFVGYTQKVATNSYDWISGQIGKFLF